MVQVTTSILLKVQIRPYYFNVIVIVLQLFVIYLFFYSESIHPNAIFNIAWADTKMKLVTASGDHTSKLIDVLPSGEMVVDRQFNHNSSVKSVMFCPGSSGMYKYNLNHYS